MGNGLKIIVNNVTDEDRQARALGERWMNRFLERPAPLLRRQRLLKARSHEKKTS